MSDGSSTSDHVQSSIIWMHSNCETKSKRTFVVFMLHNHREL